MVKPLQNTGKSRVIQTYDNNYFIHVLNPVKKRRTQTLKNKLKRSMSLFILDKQINERLDVSQRDI